VESGSTARGRGRAHDQRLIHEGDETATPPPPPRTDHGCIPRYAYGGLTVGHWRIDGQTLHRLQRVASSALPREQHSGRRQGHQGPAAGRRGCTGWRVDTLHYRGGAAENPEERNFQPVGHAWQCENRAVRSRLPVGATAHSTKGDDHGHGVQTVVSATRLLLGDKLPRIKVRRLQLPALFRTGDTPSLEARSHYRGRDRGAAAA